MGLARRVAAAVLLALTVLTITAVRPAAADTAGDEAAFVDRLNALRTSKGLKALTVHSGLTDVARAWAGNMAAAGTISHNGSLSSQGPSEWQRLGENVGMGMEVQGIHDAFVNSPGHYKNMVDGGDRCLHEVDGDEDDVLGVADDADADRVEAAVDLSLIHI